MATAKKTEQPADLMLAAIQSTIRDVGHLAKTDENKYAKYNYVSIDDYYDKVARTALDHGLSWIISEEKIDAREGYVIFTYTFDIYHRAQVADDGADSHVLDAVTFSVVHPIQGPQTAGSAASYAEKLFMRTVFKVRTGEPDADAVNPASLSSPPKAAVGAVETGRMKLDAQMKPTLVPVAQREIDRLAEERGEWQEKEATYVIDTNADPATEIIAQAFEIFTPMASDLAELRRFRDANVAALAYLRAKDATAWNKAKQTLIDRATALQ